MVSELLMRGKEEVGEILSAFEFLDAASIGAILKVSPHLLRRWVEEPTNDVRAHSALLTLHLTVMFLHLITRFLVDTDVFCL